MTGHSIKVIDAKKEDLHSPYSGRHGESFAGAALSSLHFIPSPNASAPIISRGCSSGVWQNPRAVGLRLALCVIPHWNNDGTNRCTTEHRAELWTKRFEASSLCCLFQVLTCHMVSWNRVIVSRVLELMLRGWMADVATRVVMPASEMGTRFGKVRTMRGNCLMRPTFHVLLRHMRTLQRGRFSTEIFSVRLSKMGEAEHCGKCRKQTEGALRRVSFHTRSHCGPLPMLVYLEFRSQVG
uniref:uncharacterized protein isoform X2 n=1 Tax=Myxine glutinosa TaxID=7769 RepID=UPI00358F2DF7